MPNNPSEDGEQEQQKEMKWEIPICADDWLAVFALLPPRQLGLEIALLSPRFDRMVDEHFKTRRWALKFFRIKSKIGENGTKEMRIKNHNRKVAPIVPIPRIPLPDKVVNFSRISIRFIDNDVINFLQRFRRLFASCAINLSIRTKIGRNLKSIERFIWPMIRQNICGIIFCQTEGFRRLEKYAPSILRHILSVDDDKSSRKMPLQSVAFYMGELPKLPPAFESANDNGNYNANANVPWNGSEALTKWLFSSRPENDLPPKVLRCGFDESDIESWIARIEQYKTAFVNGTSPRANFIVLFKRRPLISYRNRSMADFALTNHLTAERLRFRTLKPGQFLLVRSPIARDEKKWIKWISAAIKGQFVIPRNLITIWENDDNAEKTFLSQFGAQLVSKNE